MNSASTSAVGGNRSNALDLVRAVSILWIVGAWHLFDYFPDYGRLKGAATYRTTVALLGVFVLVSGYLMGRKRMPARQFYLKRFARIYPPFFFACAAFGVLGLSPWITLAKGAALIAMFAGPPPFTLWFIDLIVLFYAMTPLLLTLRNGPVAFVAAILAVTAAFAFACTISTGVSPRLVMYFPCYAAGLWIAGSPPAPGTLGIAGGVLLLAGWFATTALPPALLESAMASAPWALGAALTRFGVARAAEPLLERVAWARVVAHASYFLYLFHRVVYALVLRPVAHAGDGVRLAMLLCVGLPLSLALGWWGQSLYDRAWQAMLRRESGRPA